MDTLGPRDPSRFTNFNILTKVYKSVQGHSIDVDILYSNHLLQTPALEPRPILLRFHGGGLISGASLFPQFFAPWILQLAERHSAIIVSPNYRLIPESCVRDTLDDIEDAWLWVHESLPSILQQKASLAVDVARIMVTGDSAGGYLSIQLGLSHPDLIRAVTASYPSVHLEDPHFLEPRTKPVFGMPWFPKDTLTEHVANVGAAEAAGCGKIVVSADPNLERAELMWSIVQHGLFGQFYPREQRDLHPLLRLEDGERFPRGGVVVWHGKNDSVVPVGGSIRLKGILEKLDPGLHFRLVVRDGEHGFDHTANIDDDWVQDSLKDLVKAWLA